MMNQEMQARQTKQRVRDRRVEVADVAIERLLKQYGLTPEGIFGKEGAAAGVQGDT